MFLWLISLGEISLVVYSNFHYFLVQDVIEIVWSDLEGASLAFVKSTMRVYLLDFRYFMFSSNAALKNPNVCSLFVGSALPLCTAM